MKELYDVENDRDCQRVRERITEYDLVVDSVIPATSNSRAVMEEEELDITVPTLVAEVDGKDVKLVGAYKILAFLDDKFTKENNKEELKEESKEADDEADDTLSQIKDQLTGLALYLPPGYCAQDVVRACAAPRPCRFDPRNPTNPSSFTPMRAINSIVW